MDPAARVYGHRGSVVGTAFEYPVVLADTDGRDKTASAVSRHRERHVAEVAGIHVTPGGVYRSAAGTHERGLAAVADAAGHRARGGGAIERGEVQLRLLCHRDAVRFRVRRSSLIGRGALGVIVMRGGHRRIAGEFAVIEPDD